MRATKILYMLSVLLVILAEACSSDDELNTSSELKPFVRFNFLVDNNNVPLVFPERHGSLIPKSEYTNDRLSTLKIPVTLSKTELDEAITVDYSVNLSNPDLMVEVRPESQLIFSNNKFVDTIYVNVNSRSSSNESMTLKLESVSDPNVEIGNLNDTSKNDELTIYLDDILTSYSFEENRIEISGFQGETIDFKVIFPNGFILSEIESSQIFEILEGFDYSISVLRVDEDRRTITYRMVIDEDIQNDALYYQTILQLLDNSNYSAIGNTVLQIVKPISTERDNALNTAQGFYNLNDPFYRVYGEIWNDFNDDSTCQWSNFFAFSYPVVVSSDHQNAILYDNMGTSDPSDDIYHHAFQIGFRSSIATSTTNSFNFKRWFSNESISSQNSPGFNVDPAIEFFPEDGTGGNNGTVLVIPQFITISGTNGNSYSIGISGSGTYRELNSGIIELKFDLIATNQALFGGSITAQYLMYNDSQYPEPEDLLSNICVKEYEL